MHKKYVNLKSSLTIPPVLTYAGHYK